MRHRRRRVVLQAGGLAAGSSFGPYRWDRFYHVILLSDLRTRGLLESRLTGLREQVTELTELRGKNKGVVEYMMGKVRLEKEGYESLSTEVHVKSRPDGYPLIDLPLERVAPDYHVRRTLRLVPLDPDPEEADLQAVRERAEALRDRAGAPRVPGSTR